MKKRMYYIQVTEQLLHGLLMTRLRRKGIPCGAEVYLSLCLLAAQAGGLLRDPDTGLAYTMDDLYDLLPWYDPDSIQGVIDVLLELHAITEADGAYSMPGVEEMTQSRTPDADRKAASRAARAAATDATAPDPEPAAPEAPKEKPAAKKKAPAKTKKPTVADMTEYAPEVRMTEEQYRQLCEQEGKSVADAAIDILSRWKLTSPSGQKRAKDLDYHYILYNQGDWILPKARARVQAQAAVDSALAQQQQEEIDLADLQF